MPRADELRRGPVQTPAKISLQEEKARQKSREEYLQSQVNMLWRTLPKREEEKTVAEARRYPSEPQENLLYLWRKCATAGIMAA